MASFKYERQRFYPELDLEVSLDVFPNLKLDFMGRGLVKARGRPGARQRWRDDFWEWAKNRNLDAVAPRSINRSIDGTSVYNCYLKDWQTVADFIVMWVGVDALSAALEERDNAERRSASDVSELAASVRMMGEKLSSIEDYWKRQDDRWGRLSARLIETGASIASSEPIRKSLSGRDRRDSRGLRDLIWSLHVDPDHPAAA